MGVRLFLNVLFTCVMIIRVNAQGIRIEGDTLLCWNESRKLEWTDFMGKPDSTMTYLGVLALAQTASEIVVSPFMKDNDVWSYKVRVTFNKIRSWTKVSDTHSLQHEQLHFDISELFARKVRKAIENWELNGGTLDEIVEHSKLLLSELNMFQKEYDRSTAHGAIDFIQDEWSVLVTKSLGELNLYASGSSDCN